MDQPVSRRRFAGVAAATGAFGLMPRLQGKGRIPVGLQLYSIREDCQKDLPGCLAAVAKMGYDGVEKFGWASRKKTPNHGFGMAAGFEKGGHVATCAEVSVTNGAGKVVRGGSEEDTAELQ